MRVLILSHYARPHVGGIEAVVDAQVQGLRALGHEVRVITSAVPCDAAPQDGVVRIPALNVAEARAGVPFPVFAPSLVPAVVRAARWADVVHAHGFLYLPTLVAALHRRSGRRRPPLVVTEHVGHVHYDSALVDAVERAAVASVGRLCVRVADAVVVLNSRVAAEIRSLHRGVRMVVIPNGVDTGRLHPATPPERSGLRDVFGWDDRPRVVFVGRLVEKKGVHLAVAAARQAAGAWELVLVGPGTWPGEDGVRMMGPLSPQGVADVLRAADAMLLPSHGEGFPVVIQEAMACGLPVVVADDPTYGPYLDGAAAGAVRVPPEPQRLAAAVSATLAAPTASEDARRHALARFDGDAQTRALLDLYVAVGAGRR